MSARRFQQAAQLLAALPANYIIQTGRQKTFRHWVLALDRATRAEHPLLLLCLASSLVEMSDRSECWQVLHEALVVAEHSPDPTMVARVRLEMAHTHVIAGDGSAVLAALQPVLTDTTLPAALRRKMLKTLGGIYYYLGRLSAARRVFEEALALPDEGNPSNFGLRQNLITLALITLGDFAAAAEHLVWMEVASHEQVLARMWYLLTHAWFCEGIGDWATLRPIVSEMRTVMGQLDQMEEEDNGELQQQTFLLIGEGDFALAAQVLRRLDALPSDNPDFKLHRVQCWAWLERRRGNPHLAVELVEAALAQPAEQAWVRSILAMEREIALVTAGQFHQDLHPETRYFIRLRARHYLVRLRVLLALRSYHAGNPRWRRHANAVLRSRFRFGYERLLIAREPDLGALFWTLCVAEGVETMFASTALQQIGQVEPIIKHLRSLADRFQKEELRAGQIRLTQALAAIGKEEAIPFLAEMLEQARLKPVVAALEATLDHLERVPPPKLSITLLGGFSLLRGGKLINDATWQRPAAKRLFQYFALHRGVSLRRDRILDDLWPDSDPQQARSSFRTVFSWLRKAIEPYLRAKAPSRYLTLEGDIYCFDPQGDDERVTIDLEQFEQTVNGVLANAETQDIPTLPVDFLNQLLSWHPLLPDLQYESWALEARERVQEIYVRGCLYVAESLLALDRAAEALPWAERAITQAPWLEEGYQALMRAHARQGQQTLALKTYADCVASLKRELDVPPSARTEWIAKRLRNDEEI